ncbi:conserved hypothetical protein [Culex quinquefasciatus]|uniref:C2H2-type domain-containing protein n=1 Tax=Culex quinquefasciatus TaxID=7176 RepID=B0WTK6_CULQU|nr:conserved hypothetical protein [Culex quinquefasciatus]|eukprot:XP_001854623.1 conserved hypothetical protein [Culex quinquefasciatus]
MAPACFFFLGGNLLLQHTRVHLRDRSIKEFACQHAGCFYVGRSAAEVRTHLASRHSDERNFVCVEPDCDYRGKTITQLRRTKSKSNSIDTRRSTKVVHLQAIRNACLPA